MWITKLDRRYRDRVGLDQREPIRRSQDSGLAASSCRPTLSGFEATEIKCKPSRHASVTDALAFTDMWPLNNAVLSNVSELHGLFSYPPEACFGIVSLRCSRCGPRVSFESTLAYADSHSRFDKPLWLSAYQLTQAKLTDITVELTRDHTVYNPPRTTQGRRRHHQ